jgi:hypothetical protein
MRNVVLWDIETHFIPNRRRITSPLQNPACYCCVRFDAFAAVTMKMLSSGMLRRVILVITDISE